MDEKIIIDIENCALQCIDSIIQNEDRDLRTFFNGIESNDSYKFIEVIENFIKNSTNRFHRARAFKLLDDFASSSVVDIPSYLNYRASAFEEVRQLACEAILSPRTQVNKEVTVIAPVRLDLAGGWTDTPPYTFEKGGAVVNVAIDLNGISPIKVQGRFINEPVIRLCSKDVNKIRHITTSDELYNYAIPGDPVALHKAAIVLLDLVSNDQATLSTYLKHFGGFEISTECSVPMGSGLGTSSILGAALIKCLCEMMNITIGNDTLFNCVLKLEQMFTTGGGWQDQVGGVIGGAKLIKTETGVPPAYKIIPIQSGNDAFFTELQSRSIFYYTGLPRIAKNILEVVVMRYLSREKEVISILKCLFDNACDMYEAMSSEDFAKIGYLMNDYWEMKKQLVPESSNETIENVINKIKEYSCGITLGGAGGGGFMYILAKDGNATKIIKEQLHQLSQRNSSKLYNGSFNLDGMKVLYEETS
jgi:fucokinase